MPQAVAAVSYQFATWAISTFAAGSIGTAGAATAISVISATAQVAATMALSAAANAVVANNTKPRDQGGLINLELNPSAPRRLVIGKRAHGGLLVDWYLSGAKNTKLYLPIYLSEGPCGQLTRVFADGRVVYSSPLAHGVRTAIPNFRSGGDRLWLTYYDGRPGQTADPTLVALGQGWTTDNKMTGCAWVLAEMQWDSDNMRSPARLQFEHEGAKLYDRRKDSTAGGSGTHRLNDPSTWEASDAEGANPMVALDHFLQGRYWNGSRVFGAGIPAAKLPAYSRFAAQANVCDEDVAKKVSGTQKRYRANGILFASDEHDVTIKKLCTAMAAVPADFGGKPGVVGIEARTPVLTIDDADMLDGVAEIYTPKKSWGEITGVVEGKFQDPAQLYQPTPYPDVTDPDWAEEDGGEPKRVGFDLEYEIDVERAQRLALLKGRYDRRQAGLRGGYPFRAIELEQGDWFVRTGARWGEDGKVFEVTAPPILDPRTLIVSLVAQEVDPSDSAWTASFAQDGPPAPLASTDAIEEITPPALYVLASPLFAVDEDAEPEEGEEEGWEPPLLWSVPALWVGWEWPLMPNPNPEGDPVEGEVDTRIKWLYVEIEDTSGLMPKVTKTVRMPSDTNYITVTEGVVEGAEYAVSARYIGDARQSDWSVAQLVYQDGAFSAGTATSVPWSGVFGVGRPDDNADVTGDNTAAAILGQGIFATLNSLGYGSEYLTGFGALAGENSLALGGAFLSGFGSLAGLAFVTLGSNIRLADGTTVATNSLLLTSIGTAAGIAGQGGLATLSFVTIGTNLRLADGTTIATTAIVVTASGTAAGISGQGALATLSFVTIGTNLRLADGTTVATTATVVTASGTAAGIAGQGGLATLSFVTISTNLRLADGTTIATTAMVVTASGTAAGIAGQGALATIDYVRLGGPVTGYAGIWNEAGNAYQTNATLITSIGTAAGISGQGWFATQDVVSFQGRVRLEDGVTLATNAGLVTAIGTAAAFTGQGGLATLSFVTISTNLRLADGTTIATTAMVVTASGTAAAIAGQGGQATANAQRGASYSGTPTEGCWWADTSTNTLKFYTGGAWHIVSTNIGALSGSVSPGSAGGTRFGAGEVTTNSVTVTPVNAVGSVSYQWAPSTGFTAGSPTSASTVFYATIAAGESRSGSALCILTDSTGAQYILGITLGAQDIT